MRAFFFVWTVLALTMFAPAQVSAKQQFSLYEGPDAVRIGKGGARIDKNEIQYWTQGAPNRPFRVIGIFQDARKDRWWDGDAIGSKSIAKKVIEVGADAVVLLDQNTKLSSIETLSSAAFTGSSSGAFSGSTTSFGTSGSFSGTSSSSSSGSAWGQSSTFAINRTTTRLLVIRYLRETELSELKDDAAKATAADGLLPNALQMPSSRSGEDYLSGRDGPTRRPAKTASGYCLDVPRGYAGTGSLTRLIHDACWMSPRSGFPGLAAGF